MTGLDWIMFLVYGMKWELNVMFHVGNGKNVSLRCEAWRMESSALPD